MIRIYISRRVNYFLLGGKITQTVCGRAYEQGWFKTEIVLDLIWFWDYQHCRNCYVWELTNETTI